MSEYHREAEMMRSFEEGKSTELKKLLGNKIFAAQRLGNQIAGQANPESLFAFNPELAGNVFYESLFDPDKLAQGIVEITPLSKQAQPHSVDVKDLLAKLYSQDAEILTTAIPLTEAAQPDEATFIAKFNHVVTNEIDEEKNLFPEALEALKKMRESGSLIIWSGGDTFAGVPELGTGAHAAQVKKVADLGLARWRRATEEEGVELHPFQLAIAENKQGIFTEKVLPSLAELKANTVVLVDDSINSLLWTEAAIKDSEAEAGQTDEARQIVKIWAHEWSAEQSTQQFPQDFEGTFEEGLQQYGLTLSSSISQTAELVSQLAEKPESGNVVTVSDYDNTIASDALRRTQQAEKVVDWIAENGWVDQLEKSGE